MTTDEILDRVLVPRPNGSAALAEVADFLAESLRASGAEVSLHAFPATPHGFALVWSASLALALGFAAAACARRYGLALVFSLLVPLLLLAEFEGLRSPVSGLWTETQQNVVGSWPGRPGGPTLVFTAHYDSATHFGDHYSWARWGWRLGPALGLASLLSLLGLGLRRRGRELPRLLLVPAALLVLPPFAAMFWFQTLGPLLREPSPGALDNGGSLAALLRFSEGMARRAPDAPTSVQVVFLSAEEERALGSWHYAATLAGKPATAVVNLESVGARGEIALIAEDGFELRRYESPARLVEFVQAAASEPLGRPLRVVDLPGGVLTDGRSFLARGVPALTLRALEDGAFPRRLHSAHDSRERLSPEGIEGAAALLAAIVARADTHPRELDALGDAGGR
jgi:acetylornithine deacetylase/succinyl-diaminopimelate desuccinylase-like protein